VDRGQDPPRALGGREPDVEVEGDAGQAEGEPQRLQGHLGGVSGVERPGGDIDLVVLTADGRELESVHRGNTDVDPKVVRQEVGAIGDLATAHDGVQQIEVVVGGIAAV